MSTTTIATTGAVTSTAAAPLLALAGVAAAGVVGAVWAVGHLATLLSDEVIDLAEPIGADTLAGQYVATARAARDRFLRELPTNTTASSCQARDVLARALAVREAFRSQPVLAAVAEANQHPQIATALQALDQAKLAYSGHSLREAVYSARVAEEILARGARQAAKKLAEAQQQFVTEKLRGVLPALGYRVQEASASGCVALRASSEDRVLGVVVTESGKLIVEAAGFEGQACRPAIAALFHKLREEGIAVEELVSRPHGRREGGPLLEHAKADPKDLLVAAGRLQTPEQMRRRHVSSKTSEAERQRQITMAWLWGQRQRVGV
jgi:hypothetical protein